MENKDKNLNQITDELLDKFDKEAGAARKLTGNVAKFISIIAIVMSIFHLYTAAFGTLLALRQRSLHMILAFVMIFIIYPASQKTKTNRASVFDYILAALSAIVYGYLFVNYDAILHRGMQMTTLEIVFGALAILITLEATRRVVGPELPTVAIVFLLYAKFGPYLPGILAHRGFDAKRIIHHMYMTLEGILGTPIGVSATFVFMFILFGAFLDKTGVGGFFIDLAYTLTGTLRSGPAMTAVVASGLMGSISGSSVANTVTTGAFTIPLMKKLGYKPHYAGAVEATASTGGQIMPPVMGAAAFIMAEFTGIPYIKIVVAAAIPALLYYFAVGIMVHLEAGKLGLKGIPRSELPPFSSIVNRIYLFIPLVAIIFFLVAGYTPLFSAVYSILLSVLTATIVTIIKRNRSFTFNDFIEALDKGAKSSLGVVSACASAGIVVGVVTLTGLGSRVAELIVALAHGQLIPTLFFTMIASIILGMGLPTTAKYIVLATMAVPALTHLGVNLMAAHLFILYFGVVADITPPVAVAAYAGAGIAGANSMKTGFQALKLALAAFIVPYIFAIDSRLILVGEMVGTEIIYPGVMDTALLIISAIIGIVCLAGAAENYLISKCNILERVFLFGAALALLKPGLVTDLMGIVVLIVVVLLQTNRSKKLKATQASA